LILDLRQNSRLNSEHFDALKKISFTKSSDFNNLIGKISESFFDRIDWWVTLPASRNTIQSPLFYRFCCIHFIIELIDTGKNIEKIIVDSPEFTRAIKRLREKKGLSFDIDGPDITLPSFPLYIWKSIKKFYAMWRSKRLQFQAAKNTKNLAKNLPRDSLILIDQFVFPNFITKERYYNGLWDNLSLEDKERTFFVPTLVMINDEDFEDAYRKLRNCNRHFLIKEDYLKISDLLFSLFHFFRVWFIKPSKQKIVDIDISYLIREELLSGSSFENAIDGILNYCFAKRLKENSIDLSLVIDWWEGQPMDKGWNLGFNKYFPDTLIKGYLGYAPRITELQLRPSESEVKFGVAPKRINTIGKQHSYDLESKDSPAQFETAPAFRFNHLWDNHNPKVQQYSESFKIVLALSVMENESVKICEQVIQSGLIENDRFKFLIKPHPTMNINTLKIRLGENWNNNLKAIEGFTPDYIRMSDLLITGMSSVGLEAVVMGVPVIIVETMTGLSYNPIPESVPKELWRTCRTPEGITESINYFSNRSPSEVRMHKTLSTQIKQDYFKPVTKESVYNFLRPKLNSETNV